ncbi:PREDICTED: reverse mRNAase [Prunus dulcis]|uniref:PREDICTED: reverse mRNAase n=1 Tax=Prunus dulcis TaxID=3755 RepID=A0A5E4GA33_PRUDU|nr:PREDICTED: reverse mRNAase [Prunus dulcis]
MSVLRLPVGLCREIESILAQFWWSKSIGRGWRLSEFPNSLIARMLKARYFPNSDFLAASSGLLPSFTWQSLLWGRDLLRLGLRWLIGDGRLVNIYGDPWVPYDRFFTIQSVPALPSTSRVCDLITVSGLWDVGKISDTFSFSEAEAILSIPLMGDTLDWRIWNFAKNGRYSVKSGYWVALEYKRLEELSDGSVAGPSSHSLKSWKHLWKLKVPQKILYLLWRLVQSIHHSKEVLFRSRITQEDVCCHCLVSRETTIHSLVGCVVCMQSLFAFTVWVLWNERNRVLFGSQPTLPGILVQHAKDYDDDFKQSSVVNRSLSSPVRDVKWKSPTDSGFKLNVDGGDCMETGAKGVGAIVRDSQGNLVRALAMRVPSQISVLAMELYALKIRISFALDASLVPLEIESNSLLAVSMVNSEEECLATEGGLLEGV